MDARTRLRAWRAAVDLSQVAVARLLEIHPLTLGRIEDGRTVPLAATRVAIERVTAGHELAVAASSWVDPPRRRAGAEPEPQEAAVNDAATAVGTEQQASEPTAAL